MGDIVNDYCTIGIPIVHGGEGLVPLLTSCIPDLELNRGVLVEGNGLGEEGSTDGGLSIGIKLVLGGDQLNGKEKMVINTQTDLDESENY